MHAVVAAVLDGHKAADVADVAGISEEQVNETIDATLRGLTGDA